MSTAAPGTSRAATGRRPFERIALASGVLSLFIALTTGAFAQAAQTTQADDEVAGQAVAERPALWNSASAAGGIHVEFNSDPPLLPIEEFINIVVPYAESAWTSGGASTATAGSVYPGSAGTRGPGLLCDFSGGQCPPGFPPAYPLFAEASYPAQPDASTQPGDSRAHAGRDHAEATAGVSTLLEPALGPLSPVATVGSINSVARQEFSADGTTIISTAETHLSDISLLDATIHIESIDVTSISTSAGRGDTTESNVTTVNGVTVAGVPATLTNRGLEIAGQGGGAAEREQFESELDAALEAFGAGIRLVGASGDAGDDVASGSARGIEITFDVPLSGPPLPGPPDPNFPDPNTFYRNYVGTMTLGLADSSAFANPDGFGFGGGGLGGILGPVGTTATPEQGTLGGSGGGQVAPRPAPVPIAGLSPITTFGTSPSAPASSGPGATPEVAAPNSTTVPTALADPSFEPQLFAELAMTSDVAAQLSRFYATAGIAALAAFALARARRMIWS